MRNAEPRVGTLRGFLIAIGLVLYAFAVPGSIGNSGSSLLIGTALQCLWWLAIPVAGSRPSRLNGLQ